MSLSGNQKALMYALGAVARGGATRGGYHSMLPYISIGGVYAPGSGRVLVADLSIRDILDETPNTCQLTVMGTAPPPGAEIIITLGSTNSGTRLFAGNIISEEQGYYAQKPANVYHRLNGIDYTWRLAQHLVERQYTNQTVAFIAADLLTSFAEGMTAHHIAADAGAILIDAISFTNTALADALTQLCSRAGAYWYLDYFRDLHLFETESTIIYPDPTPLTPTHPSLANLTINQDLSQIVTRVFVEGGGVNAATTVEPGETIIPLTDTAVWYQTPAGGGRVASGPQRIGYSDVYLGGAGGFVGTGIGPTAAPTTALTSGGAELGVGVYQYAYTYVTAAGESLASPLAAITTLDSVTVPAVTTPPTNISYSDSPMYLDAGSAPNYNATTVRGVKIGDSVQYAWSYAMPGVASATDISRESTMSPASVAMVVRQSLQGNQYGWTAAVMCSAGVYPANDLHGLIPSWIHLWRLTNGVGPWRLANTTPNQSGQIQDNPTAAMDGVAYPGANAVIPSQRRVNLGAIGVGAASVTKRRIYRTAVNGSQLKLLTTINDNTTLTFLDAVTDAALGANIPTGDTSGLTQPAGQVVAGSTSMPVTGVFAATGGWAVIGNGEQVIRYTAFSAGQLTGIPAAGNGAITAAVAYNSTITSAPALLGVPVTGTGAIVYEIKAGDNINLLVTLDDTNAQTVLASLMGGSGIIEGYIQDRRISYTEAVARGTAMLKDRSQLLVEIHYTCRDPLTRSGATIHCALPAPTNVAGDYKIQDMTISGFSAKPGQPPTYTVQASSQRYSLDDLLRMARGTIGA